MEFARYPTGKVRIAEDALQIDGWVQKEVIPWNRITSVGRSFQFVKIETGAQVHKVQLWNNRRKDELVAAIREKLT
jgi:hypothetical protein